MNRKQLQQSISGVVRQVIDLAHPRRILLFGSAAKGDIRPDSDLDFLVVVREEARPDAVLDLLNTRVRRGVLPCDFLVATESMLQRHRYNPGLLYRQILTEGREVYAS